MSNPHIERMKQEYKELCIKLNALNKFIDSNDIYKNLKGTEQVLIVKQAGFMEAYAEMLVSRIWTAEKAQRK